MTGITCFGDADAPNIQLTQHHAGVRTITVNNPARRNALTRAMCEGLAEAADAVRRDKSARVVVVRGAGEGAFCSGADIGEFADLRHTRELADAYNTRIEGGMQAVLSLEMPVIAAIQGACVGGGMALALMCDLRFMEPSARIGITAGKLGIAYSPRWIKRLVDVVGEHAANRLMLSAELFDAQTALRWGFATEIVEKRQLDTTVMQLAEHIATLAPLSLRAAKVAIRASKSVGDEGRWDEAQALAHLCDDSLDYQRGHRAFRDGKQPIFEGE